MSEWLIQGELNGVNVPIRLDTGADLTLVHNSLMLAHNLLGNLVTISFANGETAQINTANVTIHAGNFVKSLVVGVSDTIHSGGILLGNCGARIRGKREESSDFSWTEGAPCKSRAR